MKCRHYIQATNILTASIKEGTLYIYKIDCLYLILHIFQNLFLFVCPFQHKLCRSHRPPSLPFSQPPLVFNSNFWPAPWLRLWQRVQFYLRGVKRVEHFVVCVSLPYISVIVPFSPGAQRIPNQAFQAGADRGAREPGPTGNPKKSIFCRKYSLLYNF